MKQTTDEPKHPFLVGLGEQVRAIRIKLSMTRKQLAQSTRISERHLANLEAGTGNVSVLILLDVARALDVPIAYLLQAELGRTVEQPKNVLGTSKRKHIALIGLRGAGKSTLGSLLAKDLGCRFVEISREIERLAGCGVAEIYNLYGDSGYRRFERQALREILTLKEPVVIATPGGIVSDATTFEMLLRQSSTVWLQAKPMDHLSRVRMQGDNRPMAATRTTQRAAIDDLKSILLVRESLYAKADATLDTSEYDLKTCQRLLLQLHKS